MGWWTLWCALAVAAPADGAVLEAVNTLHGLAGSRKVKGLPTIPAEAYAKVVEGGFEVGVEKVEDARARKTWGVAVLDVPIERLWGAINDESVHVTHTPLTYAELVEGSACMPGRAVLQVLDVDVPFVSDRWWVTVRHPNAAMAAASDGAARELTWVSAPSTYEVTHAQGKAAIEDAVRIGFTEGAWLLVRVDDARTLVQYYVWADPGGSLDPKAMSMFAHKSVKNTLTNMVAAAGDARLRCVE